MLNKDIAILRFDRDPKVIVKLGTIYKRKEKLYIMLKRARFLIGKLV